MRRQSCECPFLDLNGAPDHGKNGEHDEEKNNSPATLGVLGASPLESEEEADDCGNEEDRAEEVKLAASLGWSHSSSFLVGRVCERERYHEEGDCSDWEVDAEAPSLHH